MKKIIAAVGLMTLSLIGVPNASAGILITIVEDGSDVLLTYNGTLDLTAYTANTTNSAQNNTYLSPGGGAVYNTLSFQGNVDIYNSILPGNFVYGTGFSTSGGPSSRSGTFSLVGTTLHVPTGFTSGTLDGFMRWNGKSLADVQVFDGYDETKYLNGSATEFITFKTGSAVSGAAVPEPGQVAASVLLLGGIGGYVLMRRRKVAKATLANA